MKKGIFIAFFGTLLLNGIVFAQNVSDFSVSLNQAGDGVIIKKYNGAATNVVIPATIEGLPVRELADECFSGTNITSIRIPNGITTIGEDCFLKCRGLKTIDLPDTLKYLGASAFQETASLLSIVIPAGIETYGNDLPEFSSWHGILEGSGVKKVTFRGNAEYISASVFKGQSSLQVEEIVLPDGLKKIGNNNFAGLSRIKSIVIPGTVTEIGSGAFKGCTSLKEIIIPGSVISIGAGAFEGCRSLVKAVLPDGLTAINHLLFRSTAISSIVVPDTVVSIGEFAFQGTPLTELAFPKNLQMVQDGAFADCEKLKSIVIPDAITSLTFGSKQNVLVFKNCNSLSLGVQAKLRQIGYSETLNPDKSNARYHFTVENQTNSVLTVKIDTGVVELQPKTTTIVHSNSIITKDSFSGYYTGYSYVGTYFNFYSSY
jgi:hypothetical protein